MDVVRLQWQAPGEGMPNTIDLPVVVVHAPKPRHARLEPSDSPIFDKLLEEFRAGS
jgi:hypothetical protein